MTTAAQEMVDNIYNEVLSGELDVNEAIFAASKLKEYADQMNDTAGFELFQDMEQKLIEESDEEETATS